MDNVVPGSDRVSLRGSQMNCAGGRTPWRSWLSCEETVNGNDVGPDFTGAPNTGLLKHGYMFEVPIDGLSNAVPIKGVGRFAHEAAAVTPSGRSVYLTEDNFNFASGLYRYLPPRPGWSRKRILDGGVLQMLKVRGVDNADLSVGQAPGARYDVEWVTIDDPDPTFAPGTTNDQAIVAVGDQGRALGAAIFSRLEGIYYSYGTMFFTSTQGGAVVGPPPAGFGDGFGQVWAYDVFRRKLRIVYESPGKGSSICPTTWWSAAAAALVLCEDGSGDNFLRGLTRDGELFDFARNADVTQVRPGVRRRHVQCRWRDVVRQHPVRQRIFPGDLGSLAPRRLLNRHPLVRARPLVRRCQWADGCGARSALLKHALRMEDPRCASAVSRVRVHAAWPGAVGRSRPVNSRCHPTEAVGRAEDAVLS